MLTGWAFDNITRARNAIFVLQSDDYRKIVLLTFDGRFLSQPASDGVDANLFQSRLSQVAIY